MSAQFGRWNFDRKPSAPKYLEKAGELLQLDGPDGGSAYSACGVAMLYRAFHTTKESRWETQPWVSASGAVLTWDGRLDNRTELIAALGTAISHASPDVNIVAAAYERWQCNAFAKLIGDWALSIWVPQDRVLVLAKDFVGTRPLFYAPRAHHVTWSTRLEPLMLLAEESFEIDEEYVAGFLSFSPPAHLTPYQGIRSVPPACFVIFEEQRETVRPYWSFDSSKRIRYSSDAEYEEHFRNLLGESVRRRVRSDSPIFAELSGGVDSSSIVCMADRLILAKPAETSGIETISYYDDSEPSWNERPYFTKVEEHRGRCGLHVDMSSNASVLVEFDEERFPTIPGAGWRPTRARRKASDHISEKGGRVILSGIGGDEFFGGVPTPVSEFADLALTGRLRRLASQLVSWALANRETVGSLVGRTIARFLPTSFSALWSPKTHPSWFNTNFVKRHPRALGGCETRLTLFGPLPSFQENLITLDALRRQLSSTVFSTEPLCEKRYPYLDRDLLEFIFAIPREQVVRPQQRRSLMRRALTGIVPDMVLNRRRKAFVERSTVVAIAEQWLALMLLSEHMLTGELGFVDVTKFRASLEAARDGKPVPMGYLKRTLAVEYWLRQLRGWGLSIVEISPHGPPRTRSKVQCKRELIP